MTHLRIALEWFLNPDHLPLLAAREQLQADGWNIELVVPDDHYDGFAALADGAVDLVVNEPLHLVEQRALRLTSHGCFFATDGGVLMHRAALEKLTSGAPIRIASPVSNPTTDGLCVDILRGWMAGQGAILHSDQVRIEAAGFSHVDNLADGFDGAWLAFANVEGVSAQVRGMDTQMITTAEAGIPNFSALELIGAADASVGIEFARVYQPEVILMDINLPGISGVEALKILRADPATAHIPVIALSANAVPRDIQKGLDAGFFNYLTKPIKVAQLMDALDAALQVAETTSGPATHQEPA